MFFVYSLIAIVAIVLNILILRDLKKGTKAFTGVKSNLVAVHLHWSKKLGAFYYVVFFGLHGALTLYALSIGAWISAIVFVVYMVVRPRVWAALTRANWGIVGAPVAGQPEHQGYGGAVEPPSIPTQQQ